MCTQIWLSDRPAYKTVKQSNWRYHRTPILENCLGKITCCQTSKHETNFQTYRQLYRQSTIQTDNIPNRLTNKQTTYQTCFKFLGNLSVPRMTSSIQPISNHRFSDSAYVVYNNQIPVVPRHSQAHPETRARNEPRGEPRRDSKDRGKHKDLYAVPQRSYSDTAPPREK